MSNQIRILCVDDERNVLRSLERIFLDDDFHILTASSGMEGLELLAETPLVQVVISDYRMPGMNGVEFLKEVCQRYPDTIRIVLSGYADTAAVVAAINEGKIYKFIPKPWNDSELRQTVTKALEHFTTRRSNEQQGRELVRSNAELHQLKANLEQLVHQQYAEMELQSQALSHALEVLEYLPVGILELSKEGSVVQVNQAAAHLLGLVPEHALGKPIDTVIPKEFCDLAGTAGTPFPDWRRQANGDRELQFRWITLGEPGQSSSILTITKVAS